MYGMSKPEAVERIKRQAQRFWKGGEGDLSGLLEDVYEYLMEWYPLDFPREEIEVGANER